VDGVVYLEKRTAVKAGDFVNAAITEALDYDLIGDILDA